MNTRKIQKTIFAVCLSVLLGLTGCSASTPPEPYKSPTLMTDDEYVHWQLVEIKKLDELTPLIERNIERVIKYHSDKDNDLALNISLMEINNAYYSKKNDVPDSQKESFAAYDDILGDYETYWNEYRKYKEEGILDRFKSDRLDQGKQKLAQLKEKLASQR